MSKKRRVIRDETRGNYALVSLVALLVIVTFGTFIVQNTDTPLYSAKPRIVSEGGSGSGLSADLTITDLTFSSNPVHSGTPVVVTAIVKNIGNYPAVTTASWFWNFAGPYGGFGNSGCCMNISLNPGQTTTFYTTLNTNTTGNWTVTARITPNNLIENDYNNNLRTESFLVTSQMCLDQDDDGYSPNGGSCGLVDCNDNRNDVYPGATEDCDGIDNDCDTLIDEGCQVNGTGNSTT